jgi:hypothetical protein
MSSTATIRSTIFESSKHDRKKKNSACSFEPRFFSDGLAFSDVERVSSCASSKRVLNAVMLSCSLLIDNSLKHLRRSAGLLPNLSSENMSISTPCSTCVEIICGSSDRKSYERTPQTDLGGTAAVGCCVPRCSSNQW